MARSSVSFSFPAKVTARRAEVELAPSLAHLDVDSLARAARAEFDVGYVQTGDCACCRRRVTAVVRRGMVTDLRVEGCSDGEGVKPTPDLVRAMRLAQQRVAKRGPRDPKLPVPVATFVAQAAPLTIKTLVCIQICVFGHCFTCCTRTDIPNGPTFCGRVTIDTTKTG
jgi:hypothetical protein